MAILLLRKACLRSALDQWLLKRVIASCPVSRCQRSRCQVPHPSYCVHYHCFTVGVAPLRSLSCYLILETVRNESGRNSLRTVSQ
ncbi:hypothetical protein TNCT_332811 [Trichonephila clavata]|uniref:Uncharacterized protein n=1 Tax=Trichonephila clavata TaxID=2740835 RepID=A0A8X6H490_TRICU|nr:hypothetical protein TNCT_417081 [Trichonephila clavata]GFR10459.1 hypothetical protein TNCT_473191 [Trichonephila clavata]GFR15843.1 hypothetical protein TNCT_321941 [Trichonephila clavata]GFR15858.1 hypothetical protein TNCT_322001 [Trichonephila clavata]GFR15867.1 hypothetical protein TNCT_322061 [Trichonephila clavata]